MPATRPGVLQLLLKPRSLAGRLTLASCLLLPFMLGITGLILEHTFHSGLDSRIQERLQLQTYVLMGAAEAGGGELWLPERLQEPRFNQAGTGLIGLVTDPDGTLLWQSKSSEGEDFTIPQPTPANDQPQRFGRLDDGHFFASYDLVWQTEDGRETPLHFVTLEAPAFYSQQVKEFQFFLWGGLSLLALLLIIAQGMILRWGLQPLGSLATDLLAIKEGQATQLKEDYPDEVKPVTTNLNLLLETERQQRERYRHTLSDLAHSLKTPLAVMTNLADARADTELVEQTERMNQIISHQLGRAVTVNAHELMESVSLKRVAERISSALTKVYASKGIKLKISGADIAIHSDERDMMEIFGNLLDNACKYGLSQVHVQLQQTTEHVSIAIEDDGTGLAAELYERIQTRGARLETDSSGQGIGLAVVNDILSKYGGRLKLSQASLGGACFTVELPLQLVQDQG